MGDSKRGEAEYLLFEVIRQHHRLGQDLTKTDFHKRAFLTKKRLEQEGFEVSLPVYWYEHGVMVDLDDLIADFFNFERQRYQTQSGSKTVLESEVNSSYFDITDEAKDRISQFALEIAREFRGVFDTSVAKDETYERFADNEFITHLNDLRYELEDLDSKDKVARDEYVPTEVSFSDFVESTKTSQGTIIDEELNNQILSKLNDMIRTYPEEKYTNMYPLFLEWESLTRQFTYNDMPSELGNFTSKFWNTFSRVELRIHHNENISRLKINRWKGERQEHIEKFEQEIDNMQKVLLKHRSETNVLDSIKDVYSESVDKIVEDYRAEQ